MEDYMTVGELRKILNETTLRDIAPVKFTYLDEEADDKVEYLVSVKVSHKTGKPCLLLFGDESV